MIRKACPGLDPGWTPVSRLAKPGMVPRVDPRFAGEAGPKDHALVSQGVPRTCAAMFVTA